MNEAAKQVRREYMRKWRDENKGKYNSYMRDWKSNNKEKVKEYQRDWRSNNKEKVKEYQERHWMKKAQQEGK